MINVFCLWIGNKYNLDDINNLYKSVKDNLHIEHKFICLTDKPNLHTIEGIEFIKAPITITNSWSKLSLFTHTIGQLYKGKALYLGLNTIVNGSLDGVINNIDFNKLNIAKTFNTSVISWQIGSYNLIYNKFKTSDINTTNLTDLIKRLVPSEEIKHFGDIQVKEYSLTDEINKHTKIAIINNTGK